MGFTVVVPCMYGTSFDHVHLSVTLLWPPFSYPLLYPRPSPSSLSLCYFHGIVFFPRLHTGEKICDLVFWSRLFLLN